MGGRGGGEGQGGGRAAVWGRAGGREGPHLNLPLRPASRLNSAVSKSSSTVFPLASALSASASAFIWLGLGFALGLGLARRPPSSVWDDSATSKYHSMPHGASLHSPSRDPDPDPRAHGASPPSPSPLSPLPSLPALDQCDEPASGHEGAPWPARRASSPSTRGCAPEGQSEGGG